MNDLTQKRCVSCEGGVPPLEKGEVDRLLIQVPGWSLSGKWITKEFHFRNFIAAMKFVNKVARVAEAACHHPDIDIRWNKVALTLSTHSAGGLTQKDFDLAQQLDALAAG